MKVMKTWLNIFKIQLYLRYPLKTLFIAFISMITFAALTIYMSINPLNILFTPEVMNIISTKLSLSYLSLLSLSGIITYLSYNGFLEDSAIFMSMIAKKINLFYIILAKISASLVYSIVPIIATFIINYFFTNLPIHILSMLILSEFMIFYIIYFLIYSLCNEKNFGLILAYTLVIFSIISVLIDIKLLFIMTLPLFILCSIFFYLHLNTILTNSIFNIRKGPFSYLKEKIDQFIYLTTYHITCFFSKYSNNYQFQAILYKDFYYFILHFPQLLILYLCLIPVPKEFVLVSYMCLQLSIYNFYKRIVVEDRQLLQLRLISYKAFFIFKFIILNIFNVIYSIIFYFIYPFSIYQILMNILIIFIIVLFNHVLSYFKLFRYI